MKGVVYIQNLKCGGCENTIITGLSKLKNIDSISVNHQYYTVNFNYKEEADFEAAKRELYKLGYPPFGEGNNLFEKAKSYVSCVIGRVKKNEIKKKLG